MARIATAAKEAPRKKGRVIEAGTDDETNNAQAHETPEPEFTPEDVAVSELLSELGDDSATVRIYRQGKGGYRDLTLISEVGIAEFTPIMLSHPPYNGGVFRIHARSAGGLKVNRELKVEPAPVTLAPSAPAVPIPSAQDIAKTVAETLAVTLAPMLTALQRPPENPLSTLEGIRAIAEITRPQGLPPVTAQGPDAFKLMDSVVSMADRLAGLRGGGGDGDGPGLMTTLVREFGPMLREAIAKNPEAVGRVVSSIQGGQTAPVSTLPPSATAGNNPDNMTEEQRMNIMRQGQIRLGLQFLCMQAAANNDPVLYADVVLDNVPAEDLKAMLAADDWIERLAQFHPQVRNFGEWFNTLKTEILAALDAPADALDNDSGTEPGAAPAANSAS